MSNIEGSTFKPSLIVNFMLVSFEQLLNEHFHWTMLTDTLTHGRGTNTVSRLSSSTKETGSLFYGRLVVTFGTRQTGLHTSLGICARGTWHLKKIKAKCKSYEFSVSWRMHDWLHHNGEEISPEFEAVFIKSLFFSHPSQSHRYRHNFWKNNKY